MASDGPEHALRQDDPAVPDAPDYGLIASRLKSGAIVPFFGAGASIACGMPSGRELMSLLMERSKFPSPRGHEDLAHVASYLVATEDSITLNEVLRTALHKDSVPGRLHTLFAQAALRNVRLFVTTNYDDLIESAIAPRSPWVVVDRGTPGVVLCRKPGGGWEEVEAKSLREVITDRERPIVLKLHGTLDREDRENDSFLITEEHYVDFLGRAEGAQIPHMLAASMRDKSFLFLGYGLRDWNVRVLMRKLAQTRGRNERIRSWAIVRNPSPSERQLWRMQNVQLHDVDLEAFVAGLEAHL
jgi:hypothetical protein